MNKKTGRYSVYIGSFLKVLDLIIINTIASFFVFLFSSIIIYHVFITLVWIIITSLVSFYKIYRYTKITEIIIKVLKQHILFLMINLSFLAFCPGSLTFTNILLFVFICMIFVSFLKFSVYFLLKHFRVNFGGNFRKVVVLGNGKSIDQLIFFFNTKVDYGYRLEKVFDLKGNKKQQIEECFSFIKQKEIDEIYCSLSELSNGEINSINEFADDQLKSLKFIPDKKDILSKNLRFDYYDDYIPILSIRKIPLDKTTNKIVKRIFDIVFSLLIIVFVLSWLVPIMVVIIKLDSKGPVFFKQKRNGLNYQEFNCYKFRSMEVNDFSDIDQAKKGDIRITKLGQFIRKTSIDELPQFFNVLLGDMSVVGPRPHMVSHNEMYVGRVNKFMRRHFIKPGITGLAQTRGFRGEIRTNRDIVFRIKYDLFYIENWSLLLDIKIIILTVYNAIKGDEKAY